MNTKVTTQFAILATAVAVAVAVGLLAVPSEAQAPPPLVCNVQDLSSCAPAILFSFSPSTECCNNLRTRSSCLCQFVNDPAYSRYVTPAAINRISTACNITIQCTPPPAAA